MPMTDLTDAVKVMPTKKSELLLSDLSCRGG